VLNYWSAIPWRYEGVAVQLRLLTSEPDCGKWSDSRPGYFTPEKKPRCSLVRRLSEPQTRSGRCGFKKKNSVAFSPQANYTDWATAICWRNLVLTLEDRGVSRGHRGGSPAVVNLSFPDRIRYFSFK
jgi:hypothetical protein